jgi:predicted PurR-regulated permease PerM
VISALLWLLIPIISDEISRFSELLALYTKNFTTVPFIPDTWQNAVYNFFSKLDINTLFSSDKTSELTGKMLPKLWGLVNGSLSFVVGILMTFVVFLYFVFILLDYEKFNAGFASAIPLKYRVFVTGIISDVEKAMNRYFRGQALIAITVGICFSVGFVIVGLPMAILIGLFIGLLNLVPYLQVVGFVPVMFLVVLKTLETGQSFWWLLMGVAIVFIVIQAFQDFFLVPKIMGKNMGLNPAVILLALSVWGALFGLLGMIIALPMTTVCISYYKRFVLKED